MSLSRIGLVTSLISFLLIAGPVIGYRLGLNDFGLVYKAFQHMAWGPKIGSSGLALGGVLILGFAALGVIGGIVGLIGGHRLSGLLALLIGAAALAACYFGPISMGKAGKSAPPIHDISTDTDNPPVFVDILPLREGARNTAEYNTDHTARQKEAYPDVKTIVVMDKSYEEVFAAAQAALQAMDVRVVAADKEDGRLEAVWTSKAFQFKDDMVVRIMPGEGGVMLVDVRSKSRFGGSDLGENAKRIRRFMALFGEKLG